MVQIIRVTPVFKLGNGKACTTKFDFTRAVAATGTELLDVAQEAVTAMTGLWEPLWTPDIELTGVGAQELSRVAPDPPQYPSGRWSPTTAEQFYFDGNNGSATGEQGPPGARAVVSLRTALAGRRYRGRQYWPIAPESKLNSAGFIDPTWRANLLTLSQAVAADLLAFDTNLTGQVVASSKFDLATAVVSASVDTYVKSQRRSNLRT